MRDLEEWLIGVGLALAAGVAFCSLAVIAAACVSALIDVGLVDGPAVPATLSGRR